MKAFAVLVPTALLLSGCGAVRDVAVTSFRIADAPAAYIRHQIDESERPQVTTTTVVTTQTAPPVSTHRPATSQATRHKATASTHTRATATPSAQFPVARPVPGKPGYVVSPWDPRGGYVDVTGYPSGSRAKDPYSHNIFIVP